MLVQFALVYIYLKKKQQVVNITRCSFICFWTSNEEGRQIWSSNLNKIRIKIFESQDVGQHVGYPAWTDKHATNMQILAEMLGNIC